MDSQIKASALEYYEGMPIEYIDVWYTITDVRGEDDREVKSFKTLAAAEKFAKRMPEADIRLLDRSGHCVADYSLS